MTDVCMYVTRLQKEYEFSLGSANDYVWSLEGKGKQSSKRKVAKPYLQFKNTLSIIGDPARPEIDLDDFNRINNSLRKIAVRSYTMTTCCNFSLRRITVRSYTNLVFLELRSDRMQL